MANTWDSLKKRPMAPLPMKFVLLASRKGNQLCPALQVNLTDKLIVWRLLDPESRQPFISLSSMFSYCNLSIMEGLFKFDLQRVKGDFDLTQAGIEPFDDLWGSFHQARKVATELGLMDLLGGILDWKSRFAWSLDEGNSGLVHNWRVSTLPESKYSTSSLLETSIPFLEVIKTEHQIRTLVSSEQRQKTTSISDNPTIDQRIIRWSVLAYEDFIDSETESLAVSDTKHKGDTSKVSDQIQAAPDFGALLGFLRDLLSQNVSEGSKVKEINVAGRISVTPQELIGLAESTPQSERHRTALVHLLDNLNQFMKASSSKSSNPPSIASPPPSPARNSQHSSSPSRPRPASTSIPSSSTSLVSKTNSIEKRLENLETSFSRLEVGISTLIEQAARTQSDLTVSRMTRVSQTTNENAINAFVVFGIVSLVVFCANMMGNNL